MSEKLPGNGIECVIVPRKTDGEKAISASTVRQAIKDNDMNTLKKLVPESTSWYFESEEAKDVIARIRNEENVDTLLIASLWPLSPRERPGNQILMH